jgi:hypothetical protein
MPDNEPGAEHDEAGMQATENTVAGIASHVSHERSVAVALTRPGVAQAGVMALNLCVTAIVVAIDGPGMALFGTILVLNVALLIVFLVMNAVDRSRASRRAPYFRRIQRACFAGFATAAVAILAIFLAMAAGSLVPVAGLALLSAGYLTVSLAGYGLTERTHGRAIEAAPRAITRAAPAVEAHELPSHHE